MKTIGKYLTGFVLFAVIATGLHAQDAWKEYSSKEYSMAYSMPADPTPRTKTLDSDIGKLTIHSYLLDQGNCALVVAVIVYPDEVLQAVPAKVLAAGRDSMVSHFTNGKVVSEKEITIDGNPGIAFDFTSDQFHGTSRAYLVGKRLYQLQSLAAAGTPLLPGTDRFMNSFRLLKP
jgi:hypothetical protein